MATIKNLKELVTKITDVIETSSDEAYASQLKTERDKVLRAFKEGRDGIPLDAIVKDDQYLTDAERTLYYELELTL